MLRSRNDSVQQSAGSGTSAAFFPRVVYIRRAPVILIFLFQQREQLQHRTIIITKPARVFIKNFGRRCSAAREKIQVVFFRCCRSRRRWCTGDDTLRAILFFDSGRHHQQLAFLFYSPPRAAASSFSSSCSFFLSLSLFFFYLIFFISLWPGRYFSLFGVGGTDFWLLSLFSCQVI